MKTYNGAVLFVDILGISELTTSTASFVKTGDFNAIGKSYKDGESNQLFLSLIHI